MSRYKNRLLSKLAAASQVREETVHRTGMYATDSSTAWTKQLAATITFRKRFNGFTLIEVLLALVVISIALTALLKASTQNIINTQRIKEKTVSHWVAMQGVKMIQLGLLPIASNQEVTQVTTLLGQRWYWRAKSSKTAIKSMQQITVTVSKNQAGPFSSPLLAFLYHSHEE